MSSCHVKHQALRQSCGISLLSLSLALGFTTVAAQAQETVQLGTVVVQGEGTGSGGTSAGGVTSNGYVATRSAVGSKTDVPLVKVPQAINVVTNKQLEDRKVQTLKEALNYTPGIVNEAFGFDNRFDSFYIRGFNVTYDGVYRDGLRELTGNFSIFKTEPYGLDSISVLKGPSSVLYGGGAPGGIVNLVSKRPMDQTYRVIEGQIGNNNRYQTQFDFSGPVAGNDNVLYRMTGLYRQADTELRSVPDDRIYIAPALTFRSDDRDTSLTLLGEYSHAEVGGNASYVNENGRITDIESGDPASGPFVQDQVRLGYEFEHRFNETWKVRQNLRYAHIYADVPYAQIDSISADRLTASRSSWIINDKLDSFAVDNQAEATFDTGTIGHTVLMGLDYNFVDVRDGIGYGPAPDLDLVTQNYGTQPIVRPGFNFRDVTTKQHQTGIYLQDQLEWNRFILTLGGRYDWVKSSDRAHDGMSADSDQKDSAFTGRAGLGYLFDNGIAPYISYSTSFSPTLGVGFDGTRFKPTEGEQVEAGVKYQPTDLNLSASAAVFNITQSNVLSTDDANPLFQVQRGEVRSRGLELEASTSLPNGINLTAAYTYLDMEITKGDNAGFVPSGIPAHQFSIWGDYTFVSGPAEGLGLGVGLRVAGESWGDSANTLKNDARVLVDASVTYDFGKLNDAMTGTTAKLNVKNIFDDRSATYSGAYGYRGEGRSIIGSLRYQF